MNNKLQNALPGFYQFIADNKDSFVVRFSESEQPESDTRFYNITLYLPEDIQNQAPEMKFFTISLEMMVELDFDRLQQEFNKQMKVHGTILEDLSSSKASIPMFQIFEREWPTLLTYLKHFNQKSDDYDEIAKMIYNHRGFFLDRFGL
jgi:hypothetical protein